MKRILSSLAAAAIMVLAGAQAADSATVTFTGVSYGYGPTPSGTWFEDGVTVTGLQYIGGGFIGYTGTPGTIHLADGATLYASSAQFTTGGVFAANSFDVVSAGSKYCAGEFTGDMRGCGDPYLNVEVKGFLGAALVAMTAFFAPNSSSPTTQTFGSEFSAIDRLLISVVRPNTSEIGGTCYSWPCGTINLDNVNLSPVPIPAAAGLLLAGLGGLFLRLRFGSRSRKATT